MFKVAIVVYCHICIKFYSKVYFTDFLSVIAARI